MIPFRNPAYAVALFLLARRRAVIPVEDLVVGVDGQRLVRQLESFVDRQRRRN